MSGGGASGLRGTVLLAVRACGIPISVHRHGEQGEVERLTGAGQANACRAVCGAPGGRERCDASRSAAARSALRQDRAYPFVCHMGFSCLSLPIPGASAEVATLGPFLTGSPREAVQVQAQESFINIVGGDSARAPLHIDELRELDIDAVYAIGEWLTASLSGDSGAVIGGREAIRPSDPGARRRSKRRQHQSMRENMARQITALVAGGDWDGVQQMVLTVLEEADLGESPSDGARARALGVALAVLETMVGSGRAADAWERFDALYRACGAAGGTAELRLALMRFFREMQPKSAEDGASSRLDAEINQAIRARLPGRVTVASVAGELGLSAGAVSHRLRRRFGLTFSAYVGRLRMEEAKRLLRETGLSATEVGARVGVADQSNFTKQFSRIAGCSPAAYRQQYGRKR